MEKQDKKELLAELSSILQRKKEIESHLNLSGDVEKPGSMTATGTDFKRNSFNEKYEKLRELAEEKLKESGSSTLAESDDDGEFRDILHELEVHQVELEIQNEQLRVAQEELTLLHNKYSDLFNYAPIGYLTVSREGRIHESNDAANTILGYQKDSLNGKRLPLFIVREDQNDFYDFLRNIIRLPEEQTCEIKLRKRDGSIIHCNLKGISVSGTDGTFTQYYITLSDITERVTLDEAYRNLIRFSLQGYAIARHDRIVFANRMVSQITGYSLSDFYAFSIQDLLELIVPEQRETVKKRFFGRLDGKQEKDRYELEIIRADGSHAWIEAFPVLTNYQGSNAIQVTMIDITKRKRSELELQRSRAHLQLITDNIPISVAHFDSDLQCLFANKAFSSNEKIEEDIIEDLSLKDMLGEKLHKEVEEYVTRVFKGETTRYRYSYVSDDLKKVFKDFYFIPHKNGDGKVKEFFVIITNISDIKNAEERVKKYADELKELNKSKDKLFSIIAHDLRNPFNAFIGFSDYLRRKANKIDGDTLQSIAEKMYFSARNVFDLIENLLQWSRMQTGRIQFKPTVLSVSVLLENVIKLFRASADKKMISLDVRVDEEMLIKADELMISSVFRNLLSNAIKFTEDKGNILISASIEGETARIIFEDDGLGMEEADILRLFRIDEKISSQGTHGEEGTGLGLILSKEFIEKNHGTINVISEKGKGSSFTITLPAVRN